MVQVNKEMLALLRRLGLNQYESKTYLALMSSSPSTATELSDVASIPRPRVYDVLDKLEKKGFVITKPGRPTKYKVVDPSSAVFSLRREKEENHKKEIHELSKLEEQLLQFAGSENFEEGGGEDVYMIKERKNIYALLSKLIASAEKSVLIASHEDGLSRKRAEYGAILHQAQKRGVDVKLVKGSQRVAIIDNNAVMFLNDPDEDKNERAALIRSPYVAEKLRTTLSF